MPAAPDASPPPPSPWARRAGGTDGTTYWPSEAGRSIATLASGDLVIGGQFMGTATFGASTTFTSLGGMDGFVAGYRASDGAFQWLRPIASSADDEVTAVAAAPDGGFAVTGTIRGNATFGAGESTQTTVTGGPAVAFVARYAGDGSFRFVHRVYSPDSTDLGAASIAVASDGAMYLTGSYGGTAVFGEGEPNQTTLGSSSVPGIYFARFAADGTLSWVVAIGPGESFAVTAMPDGGATFGGLLRYGGTFGAGQAGETTVSASQDVFLARYAADGTFDWVRTAGGPGQDFAWALDTILGTDTLVVAGTAGNGAVFGAGQANQTTIATGAPYLARYGGDGTFAWVRTLDGGPANWAGVAGFADGSATWTAGMVPNGGTTTEGFVARYDAAGTQSWLRLATGTDTVWPLDATPLAGGATAITGFFDGTATFNGDEVLTSAGSGDIFVARVGS